MAFGGDDWRRFISPRIEALNGAAFAGHADWRLPNVNELSSLLDFGPALEPV
jgi:hypothetical protein